MGMTVMVIGSGAREHVLAHTLADAPSVDAVVSAPGNPGTATVGENLAVDPEDPGAITALAQRARADLVVVGPEAPLVAGVADALEDAGVPVFGPRAAAARIEGSKAFAKEVMAAAGVPTGGHVATGDRSEAHAALERFAPPWVVKADGLAAGKGVRICDDIAEARDAVDDALVRRVFGRAGATVVIEEYLDGPERSVFAVCDGARAVVLQPAQDYKRAFDADTGPNTGGMGAYAPVPGFGIAEAEGLLDTVFRPVLAELAARGTPYRGLLYAGLVDTADGPKVLEFNARFGDPETQVVLPLLASDLGALLLAAARGSLEGTEVAWHPDAAVTVVLASGGYPEGYDTGVEIAGIDDAGRLDGVTVFHAGTRTDGARLVTAGGRVLSVTATGDEVAHARARAYEAADRIRWEGIHRREDIAAGVRPGD